MVVCYWNFKVELFAVDAEKGLRYSTANNYGLYKVQTFPSEPILAEFHFSFEIYFSIMVDIFIEIWTTQKYSNFREDRFSAEIRVVKYNLWKQPIPPII